MRAQILTGLAAFCREPACWAQKLPHLVIAYEPVWAIGTGLVAGINQIDDMHNHIHNILNEQFSSLTPLQIPSVLYGGSVKENATSILGLEKVGGALVGGASLSAVGLRPL